MLHGDPMQTTRPEVKQILDDGYVAYKAIIAAKNKLTNKYKKAHLGVNDCRYIDWKIRIGSEWKSSRLIKNIYKGTIRFKQIQGIMGKYPQGKYLLTENTLKEKYTQRKKTCRS